MIKKLLVFGIILTTFGCLGQEICNNGIDDDADGLVDLNDVTDCACNTLVSTTVPSSLIQNPSFEDFSKCPTGFSNPTLSQLSYATGWVQATKSTTDYFNSCGFLASAINERAMTPFPDGNGIIGLMMELDARDYIGTCLSSPLLKGVKYTLQFNVACTTVENGWGQNPGGTYAPFNSPYGPINLTLFGAQNCSSLPVETELCPTSVDPNWSVLGDVSYTPSETWGVVTISFTPSTDIYTIMLGSPCEIPSNFPEVEVGDGAITVAYFLMDNLILNETQLFDPVSITKKGSYCTNDILLTANVPSTTSQNAEIQWYKDGIALVSSNSMSYTVPAGKNGTGNYQVRLIDNGLCGLSNKLELKEVVPPTISIEGKTTICFGDSALLIASGANTYKWSPKNSLSDSVGSSVFAKPTQTTTYTVIGDEEGCSATKDITLNVNPTQVTANAGIDTEICNGESIVLHGIETGATSFQWNNGQSTKNITVNPTNTTDYIFTAINGDCESKDSVKVTVNPIPSFSMPAEVTIEPLESTTLVASGGGTYVWSPTTGLSCADCASPTAAPSQTTEYCVVVTNTEGCEAKQCTKVKLTIHCGDLFIPTVFSPNGDNKNDKLEVKMNTDCVTDYSFMIFDRWGELVFESTKITDSWDGKFKGKELDNAEFVYYLKIKVTDQTQQIIRKGSVSIIR